MDTTNNNSMKKQARIIFAMFCIYYIMSSLTETYAKLFMALGSLMPKTQTLRDLVSHLPIEMATNP